ncbi:MAG: EAL domain-containing protein [Chloroflexi bacterium]|nr:EAL domain-containing protein [Chloroflexota bacterium]
MQVGLSNVLLIEDNRGDAGLVRALLAEAPGGPVAVEWVDRLSPGLQRCAAGGLDAVLLDLSLPDSQGLETVARLRAHSPGVPIVVLTGLEDEALGIQAVQVGAQDYLVKGQVASAALVRSLRYALERTRAEATLRALYAESERRRAEAEALAAKLAASEQRVRTLYQAMACGVLVWDASGRIIDANTVAEQLLGARLDQMHAHTPDNPLWRVAREDGSDLPATERPALLALGTRRPVRDVTLRVTRPDGEARWLLVCSTPVLGEDGEVVQVASSFVDITARKRMEEALEHHALHDVLTELPNRTLLHDRLRQAILAARRDNTSLALLAMDLDRFHEINDALGHRAGDVVLQQVGQRLRATLRASDTVARLDGDEFAALLPGTSAEGATLAAGKLLRALEQPCVVERHRLDIGASVGIALYPEHGEAAETLLRQAEVALYVAKRAASSYAVYAPEQDQYSPSRLGLVGELRQAIEQGQLRLHYQPKVGLKSGRVVGVEALVRWQHPERGLVPPDQFIPLAEQTGLIKPLTEWVLGTALRQCQAWHRAGLELAMAVNLSMRNLHDPQLPDAIAELLAASGVPPAWLELELTESVVMADPVRAMESLRRLCAMGVRIAIDDFGTGYSSLGYLKRLPVGQLKVDRSFVRDMAVDQNSLAIVRATIELGHTLDLEVVAEGVEDRSTWDLLIALGCDLAQGYYLSRPLPAAELECWLREWPLES